MFSCSLLICILTGRAGYDMRLAATAVDCMGLTLAGPSPQSNPTTVPPEFVFPTRERTVSIHHCPYRSSAPPYAQLRIIRSLCMVLYYRT
ncbi:hypothetical protein C8Q79DRAFT_947221 [Trametes meyenii]|nr:hypothetical protein C8Q79DRAFT_947221 [Trametes meyenii]